MTKQSAIVLRDDPHVRENLLPLTFTRPISDLRVGILTIRQKWELRLPGIYGYAVVPYLSNKYRMPDDNGLPILTLLSDILPDDKLVEAITALRPGEQLTSPSGRVLATLTSPAVPASQPVNVVYGEEPSRISQLYDIFLLNGSQLEADFKLITAGRESTPLSSSNSIVGDPSLIFLEPGAKAECAVFNTHGGPIYLGADAEIMEGALIRGSLAMLPHSVVNMGTKIYGPTTLGPWCKVGGELNNVVMQGYSNKAHDGFLGNAVIGEWCNIGGGSVASNLKNDYTEIKLWNYEARRFLRTGLQFCGLIMGDHSKVGINTMFNTATVFGVGVNFHGSGYPRNFTASFQEGSTAGMNELPLSRFLATAERVMARRGIELTEEDKAIYAEIHEITAQFKG